MHISVKITRRALVMPLSYSYIIYLPHLPRSIYHHLISVHIKGPKTTHAVQNYWTLLVVELDTLCESTYHSKAPEEYYRILENAGLSHDDLFRTCRVSVCMSIRMAIGVAICVTIRVSVGVAIGVSICLTILRAIIVDLNWSSMGEHHP